MVGWGEGWVVKDLVAASLNGCYRTPQKRGMTSAMQIGKDDGCIIMLTGGSGGGLGGGLEGGLGGGGLGGCKD